MLKLINNVLLISEIEDKIKNIKNVLLCSLVGFNTQKPSVKVFFKPELEQTDKYNMLNQVKEIMREYGLNDNEETRWHSVWFEVIYSR